MAKLKAEVTQASGNDERTESEALESDLAPDVENRILSKITTNSRGFQLLKIWFFRFFGLGAISKLEPTGEPSSKDEETRIAEKSRLVEKILTQKAKGRKLSGADLSGADLSGVNLILADLRNANLIGTDLSNADLWIAYLNGADLSGADLSGADLSGADLSGADLSGAYLNDANLIGADLIDTNLIGADLIDTNLIGADLSGANLSSTNLSGADLIGVQVHRARFEGSVGIPEEIKLDLIRRGAIFEDSPGDRDRSFIPVPR
ncbi:MAG: pentapeptide repeat-containing protein [Symploca sp. SIO1C2]|nr:pentapeptide repeat-containing protein [Symploca sp. SIO1C2]